MEIRVYLKVCEGCGCLWYRPQHEVRVYCVGCDQRLKEFPTAQSRKRPGRPKKLRLPTVFAVHDLDYPDPSLRGSLESSLPEQFTQISAWLPPASSGIPSAYTGGAQ